MEVILEYVGLLGSFTLAISGPLTAMDKRFDPFGVFIIAFVTAVGGGTLRDLLIGSQPVGWMLDLNYLLMIGVGILCGRFCGEWGGSCFREDP